MPVEIRSVVPGILLKFSDDQLEQVRCSNCPLGLLQFERINLFFLESFFFLSHLNTLALVFYSSTGLA